MRDSCVVCGAALPTGYRGRPRVTCSTECFNRRRAIRARNKTRLVGASHHVLRAVAELTPWPDLQLELTLLVGVLNQLDDEVTSSQMEVEHVLELAAEPVTPEKIPPEEVPG